MAEKNTLFQKGNQTAKKLTTDELKKLAYEQYCEHIASGRSKKTWCLEHEDMTLTWQTMEKYIQEDQAVFNPLKKQIAEIKSYHTWETVVQDKAKGKNTKADTATLQMVMRNKFGWDKADQAETNNNADIERLYSAWSTQLKTLQDSARKTEDSKVINE